MYIISYFSIYLHITIQMLMYVREYYRVCLIVNLASIVSRDPLILTRICTSSSLGAFHVYISITYFISINGSRSNLTDHNGRIPVGELTEYGNYVFHGLYTSCQSFHSSLAITFFSLNCLERNVWSIIQEIL